MRPTEDSVLQEAALLPGGQLPFAGGAGEAGQVEGAAPHATHPVAGADVPAAASASGAVSPEEPSGQPRRVKTVPVVSCLPEVVQLAEHLLLFDVAAHMSAQGRLTNGAGEAANVPTQIIHLA